MFLFQSYGVCLGTSSLLYSVICGIVTSRINRDKGYNGGFFWGFFLGIIGIIIVALRGRRY